MESDDESFYITQDSCRKHLDVDESGFDPNVLEWVNNDEAQDEKKDKSNGTEGADRKKCDEATKIVKIEINNCSDCVFNRSCMINQT